MTVTASRRNESRASAIPSDRVQPSVLAVVVTHRGRPWLRECLTSLSTQSYPWLDVLVVDDASPDYRKQPQLRRIAKRHLRKVRWGYLRTPRPMGFGGAINWALGRVRTDAELLLFIHDDAALSSDSVEHMVGRMLADDRTAIVGPKIVLWSDPTRLEEVGMATDRFGYPYKGLEEGEIDLGQHDLAAEVFFVTSTCMLVRRDVFEHVGGWDAVMRAFAEDLDLCWRVRMIGHSVRVEPRAKARHAIAMATGQRRSPFAPSRYFIRRNRLRAVAKNVSRARLVALIPQFLLLALAEMLAFVVLRQPREILNLGRALGWNVAHLPQTLNERARIQRQRRVPDRSLQQLTVREHTRVRFYLSRQAERLEQAWGRRGQYLAAQGQEARAAAGRLRGWPGALLGATLVALLLGFRHVLLSPPAALGELLPYPEPAGAMWRAFLSPWQDVGLGQPGPGPPAFLLLALFPVLAFGALGAAQKLLVLALVAAAGIGGYKLVSDLVNRQARLVAGGAYALGSVGYTALRGGRLGALVFMAAAPFVLLHLLRLTGWTRPPGWRRGRAVARVAVTAGVSGAFVPGSLFLYALSAAALAGGRGLLDRGANSLRGFTSSLTGLVVAWALLLPWSASWWRAGGPLDLLLEDDSSRYARSYEGHGMLSVVLGQTPQGLRLFGVALVLLGAIAVAISDGQRRRVALALWAVIVASGLVVAATAAGVLRPLVATPVEAGVLPAAAFAGLAGISVGAFRLDLPRRDLGAVHALTVAGLGLAGALAAVSLGPALLAGGWRPGGDRPSRAAPVAEQLRSLFEVEARQRGTFRALWVGTRWASPVASVARPLDDYVVTGPRGQTLSDLFERTKDSSDAALRRVMASIRDGSMDRGGRLLGAFNIRYIVLERGDGVVRWVTQRDLAVVRTEPEYVLLKNQGELPRAGVYDEVAPEVRAVEQGDPALARGSLAAARVVGRRDGAARYFANGVSGPGTVFLAEAADPGWTASIEDAELERVAAGWGNAFQVPRLEQGRLVVAKPRSLGAALWLLGIAVAWVMVGGAALSAQRQPSYARRPPQVSYPRPQRRLVSARLVP